MTDRLEDSVHRLLVWDNRVERHMVDQDSDARRISNALKLEELALVKAIEEINEESRHAEEQAVRDCAARGILQSGIFGSKIIDIQRDRAKRMVDKRIELRR